MIARALASAADRVRAQIALAAVTRFGRGVRVVGTPAIENAGSIVLGANITVIARPAAVQLVTAAHGSIEIGDGTILDSGVTVRARNRVTIGAGVYVGASCLLDDDPQDGGTDSSITIGDGAWIEEGVTLLAGANVAPRARVTRGSTVGGRVRLSGGAIGEGNAPERDEALVERLRGVVAKVVPRAAWIARDADLRSLERWDSLAALRVLVAMEAELGVSLPVDLFSAPRTLDTLADVATARLAAHARTHTHT